MTTSRVPIPCLRASHIWCRLGKREHFAVDAAGHRGVVRTDVALTIPAPHRFLCRPRRLETARIRTRPVRTRALLVRVFRGSVHACRGLGG